MADTLKCPKCGEENPKSNRFCDSCGGKLTVPSATAAAVKEEPAKPGAVKKVKAAVKEEVKTSKPFFASEEPLPADLAPSTGGFVINWEIVAWILIIIGAFAIRFIDLGIKPLHHDESMHAFYGWKLFKGEGYSYNPMMHGPFHYHANALVYFLFGTSDYTARVAPAIYGMFGILLMWNFRPYMGKVGALIAAFMMAVSPTWAYQARFIREDIFMAVDTIMIFIGLMRYFDTRKLNWLYLAAVGLAFSWATKEANYITMFIFGTFLFGRWVWEYSLRAFPDRFEKEGVVYKTVEYWLGPGKKDFLKALGLFVLVHGLLYFNKQGPFWPNFWNNLKGIPDGYVGGLLYWLGQHGVERGSQPWYFYLLMTPFYEMLSVFFMLIASVYYLIVAQKRTFFNIFCIYWWILSVIVYSWAGEKMPWLAIHPLLPMLILGAQMATDVFNRTDWGWKRSAGISVFVLLAMLSIHGTIYVCFYGDGASPKESLVYVQTSTDVTMVTKKIIKLSRNMKNMLWDSQAYRQFDETNMEIVCEDYCTWPFAWYLRDYKKIAYDPKNIPEYEMGKPIILSGIEEANAGHDQRVKDMLASETKMENGKMVPKKPEEIYIPYRYKLREWWAPDEPKWWKAPLFSKQNVPGKLEMLWDRFLYREVWNDLGSYDFVVYIRKDLEKFWAGGVE